jgi:hypothetical protein
MPLTTEAFQAAAKRLKCDVAAVRAVAEVESSGGGFLADGKVKILFEGHKFSAYTGHQYDTSNPAISYPKWDRTKYATGPTQEARSQGEWGRLNAAIALNKRAAWMSASWGMFQVMGFNFAQCDFVTIEDFVAAMKSGEDAQLAGFCGYLLKTGLDDELREHRWPEFARRYNGADYSVNKYDVKLAKAWAKYAA